MPTDDGLKIREVRRFSRSGDGFAILFHERDDWGKCGHKTMLTEPTFFVDDDHLIEAITWEGGFDNLFRPMETNARILGSFDFRRLSEAEPVKSSQLVQVTENTFCSKREGNMAHYESAYDAENDRALFVGNGPTKNVIDLGKGVYLLMNKDEVIGLVLLDAKKKFESAKEMD